MRVSMPTLKREMVGWTTRTFDGAIGAGGCVIWLTDWLT